MAGVPLAAIQHRDVYSCFPSAVQVLRTRGVPAATLAHWVFGLQTACAELGISTAGGGVGLTQTGGLPYHGGPGNNYALHGVAAMVHTLRQA
jgi:acetyl-CoA C-acetyltransferase